jgi:hypothetical protein
MVAELPHVIFSLLRLEMRKHEGTPKLDFVFFRGKNTALICRIFAFPLSYVSFFALLHKLPKFLLNPKMFKVPFSDPSHTRHQNFEIRFQYHCPTHFHIQHRNDFFYFFTTDSPTPDTVALNVQ